MRLSNDTIDRGKKINREKQANSETEGARTTLSGAGEKVEKTEKSR